MPPVPPEPSPGSGTARRPEPATLRPSNSLTRRTILGGAAAAPVAAFLPGCGSAPAPGAPPTLTALQQANARSARPTAPDRLPALLPAVRMNHAFFRAVRALDIEDRIEPAIRFSAEARAGGGSGEGGPA